jgi:Ni/Co efflux regulator RcnB
MRKIIPYAAALAALSAAAGALVQPAMAQPPTAPSYAQQQQDYQQKQAAYQDQQAQYQDQKRQYHHALHQWARGAVLPHHYFSDNYYVNDWQARHLHAPGEGYRWVRDEDGAYVLAAVGTGVISDVVILDNNH